MKRTFVVYQMGKVASTSIVNTLDRIDDSEAYQTHFLSENTFRRVFLRLTDANLSDYMYHHLSRQAFRNFDIHRMIKRALLNAESENELHIISLYRSPLSWTCSALIQDSAEYKPIFIDILKLSGKEISGDDEIDLRNSLYYVLSMVRNLLEGGFKIEDLAGIKPEIIRDKFDVGSAEEANLLIRILALFSRPHNWFFNEFEAFLNISLNEFSKKSDTVLFKKNSNISIYILSYENLEEDYNTFRNLVEFETPKTLTRDNESADKKYSNIFKEAFNNRDLMSEISRLSRSKYTYFFGNQ